MARRGLLWAALALAVLVWMPLGIGGVPLDTPDGFLHLGWAVGWARQIAGGWWWPQWTDINWGGAGSFALAVYPPLFRQLVGIPILIGVPPDQALASALLVLLLVNALGAVALGNCWQPTSRMRWLLLLGAALNPYLLVNVYVRGAWPEALAQALLWWLALGWLGILRSRRWGVLVSSLALAGIVLSNWNTTLLALLIWGGSALTLGIKHRWTELTRWLASLLIALTATAVFWWPALQLMPELRAPIPEGLFSHEFFLLAPQATKPYAFSRLLWIQALAIALLLGARGLGLGRSRDALGRWGLLIACTSLVLMVAPSEPLYGLLTPLQRIQFPWRWLGPAWLGCLIWCCSPVQNRAPAPGAHRWARVGAALVLAGALGGWFDGLWRFRTNVLGHRPSSTERQALRSLLLCDPVLPCPRGLKLLPASGELAKRFLALPDGRVALTGVPDYSPAGIPQTAWQARFQTFWIPRWPQARWAQWSGKGAVHLVDHGPRHRLISVMALEHGNLRLMQWAHPRWQVWRVRQQAERNAGDQSWRHLRSDATRDQNGWINMPIKPGRWWVLISYGKPSASLWAAISEATQ